MGEPGSFGPVTPLVELRRGGRTEGVHYGVGVIAASNGEILGGAGAGSSTSIFPRSALKPFQLEALLSHPRATELRLSDQELAVLTASHDGEPAHVKVIEGVLRKVGADPSDLACGLPDRRRADSLRPWHEMMPIYAECSGKHAAMLTLARLLDSPFDGYLDPAHPVQAAIKQTIVKRLDVREQQIGAAIDGCGAPAYHVPLRSLAVAYAQLAASAKEPGDSALSRIASAMVAHPVLVGGSSSRTDTDAMIAAPGVVAKTGKEGVLALAHVSGVSCVIKVSDGDPGNRAVACITATLLERTGWIANTRVTDRDGPTRKLPSREGRLATEVAPTHELERFLAAATGVQSRSRAAEERQADLASGR